MDQQMLLDHLKQAEQHVALGKGHVALQQRLIADLERDGHDTTDARALLKQFEEIQVLHLEHHDRLLRELRAAGRAH